MTNNRRLKRLNIFFPLRTKHLERLADLAMPRIFNQPQLLSFYGLNCETIRHNKLAPDFLEGTYHCLASPPRVKGRQIPTLISCLNYKYK